MKKGINTINSYFTLDVAKKYSKNYQSADIVTASNVFAHADKLEEIAKSAFEVVKKMMGFLL